MNIKKRLRKVDDQSLYHVVDSEAKQGPNKFLHGELNLIHGNCTNICGIVKELKVKPSQFEERKIAWLSGDVSGLSGDISGIYGNATGVVGDLDNCLPGFDRFFEFGIDIEDLLEK